MAAGAAHGDRPHDHELVQVLGIGELGDLGQRQVAALEHLGHVHLGDAPRGLPGVVIVLDVDDQALEHAGHLLADFPGERLELARLDECGDVVVGVKALLLRLDPGANASARRAWSPVLVTSAVRADRSRATLYRLFPASPPPLVLRALPPGVLQSRHENHCYVLLAAGAGWPPITC